MSAALLLTVAMAGNHNACPSHSSYHYAAPYGYSYSAPYHYGYGSRSMYSSPYSYRGYNSPGRGYAYRGDSTPNRGYAYRNESYRRQNDAGSSGYQERTAGFTPQPTSQSAIVQMTDRARFEPAQITVNVGDTVEWRNVSQHPHTVTANPEMAKNAAHVVLPQGVEPFDSGEIAPGAKFSHTFTAPGTYIYVCRPHEEMGMVGIVVVKEQQGNPPDAKAPAQNREQGQTRGGAY